MTDLISVYNTLYRYIFKKEGGGGAEQVLAMLKGGTTSFEIVLTQKPKVLAIDIVMGVRKTFRPLKGGTGKLSPCLEERGRKKFCTCDFPIL